MEFNFTSQICTTREQSERLVALGLKKGTADMTYFNDKICSAAYNEMECPYDNLVYPAWSLHRLLELCNVYYIGHRDYNSLIDYLENIIKEDYFNKDYLE